METKKQSFLMKNSILAKAGIIAILTLLMLIPINMVKSLIEERKNVKNIVEEDIINKWGGAQEITGPIMVLPFCNENKEIRYAYFLPEEYNVNGEIKPEKKKDGILNILCYQGDLTINSKFNIKNYNQLNIKEDSILWQEAFVMIGISDLNGIKDQVIATANGKNLNISAEVKNKEILKSGLSIPYPINPNDLQKDIKLDIKLTVGGSEGLYIIPIGKKTSAHLLSNYKSAKYTYKNILPSTENNENKGFDAQWNLFDYNLNYTQMWIGSSDNLVKNKIGVDILLPVDHYQKNIRSVKYAILFIALTFIIFFIVELTSHKPIHPVQYLLASFALVLFYSLLLALSEHIGFNWAYLTAAFAIICLLTAYSHSIFCSKKETIFMGIFLSALYIFLYIIIQEEEKSLLLGNIGLFIVLAVVMYVSRKINWYKDEPMLNKEVIEDNKSEKQEQSPD